MTDPGSIQEQEWWLRFQQGDNAALEKLYRSYFKRLYNFGFKFSNEASFVEDAIQNLFLKLMRSRERLATPDSIQGYLFFSLRSIIFDELEKTGRQRQREILTDEMPFNYGEMHDPLAERQEQEGLKQRFNNAMSQLTPRQREAVYLRYNEELSYPDIAVALDLTQKAAYKLIGRAMATLRTAAGNLNSWLLLALMLTEKGRVFWDSFKNYSTL